MGFKTVGESHHTLPAISVVEFAAQVQTDPEIGAVVVGLDPRFTFFKLAYASSCLLNPDCLFIATNPDHQVPVGEPARLLPGNGSLVAAVSVASLREPDIIVGKPNPTGMELILETHKLDPKKVLMVGDRLDTDISFGINAGTDTMVVLTGVTKMSDAIASEATFIADSVAVLLDT
eukprot:c13872_g1_i4.p1 GENE.c13872_g1_i4~~c13872_g1_i4.p1  ORF type:complete len:176 (+),score=43.37 c13872_g1_i4:534-1061(+)